ncbi:hypothetical protein COOONC_19496, partial [Cooperia oncophora]
FDSEKIPFWEKKLEFKSTFQQIAKPRRSRSQTRLAPLGSQKHLPDVYFEFRWMHALIKNQKNKSQRELPSELGGASEKAAGGPSSPTGDPPTHRADDLMNSAAEASREPSVVWPDDLLRNESGDASTVGNNGCPNTLERRNAETLTASLNEPLNAPGNVAKERSLVSQNDHKEISEKPLTEECTITRLVESLNPGGSDAKYSTAAIGSQRNVENESAAEERSTLSQNDIWSSPGSQNGGSSYVTLDEIVRSPDAVSVESTYGTPEQRTSSSTVTIQDSSTTASDTFLESPERGSRESSLCSSYEMQMASESTAEELSLPNMSPSGSPTKAPSTVVPEESEVPEDVNDEPLAREIKDYQCHWNGNLLVISKEEDENRWEKYISDENSDGAKNTAVYIDVDAPSTSSSCSYGTTDQRLAPSNLHGSQATEFEKAYNL